MSTNIDTGKRVSKITYNGVNLPIPDTNEAFNSGKQEGIQTEYNRFWDALQLNGTLTNYRYGFATPMWNDSTFSPKWDITLSGKCGNFMYGIGVSDLAGILDRTGVTLDTSGATEFTYAFASSSVTHLPVLSAINATALSGFCSYCPNLVTIDKLTLKSDGTNTFASAFEASPNLTNITIEGAIGTNGLKLNQCEKLTEDSLMSIINALQKKSSGTWTLTLGTTNLAKLTDAEKAVATQKGWTLA